MNKAQQYINDYLNCGMMHFRAALTPTDTTGNCALDRLFRKEIAQHCEQSQYWETSHSNDSVRYINNTMNLVIVLQFHGDSSGISHNY